MGRVFLAWCGAATAISGGVGFAVAPMIHTPPAPASAPASAPLKKVIDVPGDERVASAPYLRADQVAELAASLREDPVAAQFGRTFMEKPTLRAHWEAYQKDSDFSAFFNKIGADPNFAELNARLAQEEGLPLDARPLQTALSPLLTNASIMAMLAYAEKHEHDPAAQPGAAHAVRPHEFDFDTGLVDSELAFRRRSHRASLWLFGLGAVLAALAFKFKRRGGAAEAEPEPPAAAPPPAAPAATGLEDKYDILRVLARGDAAQLLEARDKKLDRVVMIHRLAGGDAQRRQSLAAAPRAAAAVRHPGLLDVYEIFEDGRDVCIVYERCRGKTVAELVFEQGPMQPARAAEVLEPACLALENAHSRGVFHRWLALERLLVTEQGFTKIIGLGMSRTTGGDGRSEDVRALGACLERMLGPGAPPGLEALVRDAASAPQRVSTAAEFLSRLKQHPTSPAPA